MRKRTKRTIKPSFQYEKQLWKNGFSFICGIDEAGRGALAGPIVAAAVILHPKKYYRLRDSKLIQAKTRQKLAQTIKKNSLAFGVGIIEVEAINRYGIQTATYLAFHEAIKKLSPSADYLLIDHYRLPATLIPQTSLTSGDKLSQSIAAASILAKVTRDEIMDKLAKEKELICFEFGQNLGYGTAKHRLSIRKYGPSYVHRLKYRAVDKKDQTAFNFLERTTIIEGRKNGQQHFKSRTREDSRRKKINIIKNPRS